jgi:hypothetical protein
MIKHQKKNKTTDTTIDCLLVLNQQKELQVPDHLPKDSKESSPVVGTRKHVNVFVFDQGG